MNHLPFLAALALAGPATPQSPPEGRLELRPGDRICLVGNALAERMQHDGWLETRLQARFPELELSFRNLGFSGDEVAERRRTAGFGSPEEWLERAEADVVLAFFGYVESFDGEEGLPAFRAELREYVEQLSHLRVVLFSPIPHESALGRDVPSGAEHNERIRAYRDAIEQVARETGVGYVDLFAPMQRTFDLASGPLTINGVHLTSNGNDAVATAIEDALSPVETRRAPDPAVRALVLQKNLLWFNRYRATDGYNVYGGRSSLRYTEEATSGSGRYAEGVSNFDILQRELVAIDAMCADLDQRIQAAARGDDPASVAAREIPPLIPVKTNRPGPHEFLGGDEAVARMTPAEGMQVNLFASEELFPELVNPVQMAWDTRGRLWVALWPTYPHWTPGEPMDDKLLILEDTDGDGRADRSQVFASDLHNPTGFEFWNGGVVVANCPDLLFLEDTDGDDVYDRRERLLHGLSSADTHHGSNSFVLGPDGALYFQEGTFHQSQVENVYNGAQRNSGGCVWRFEPRSFRVERYIPYGFANPHGHVFDRWGQDFMTDGTGNVNYYALPFSGHLDFPARHSGYFPFFQQRSRPAGGTEVLSSRHFPDQHQGNYLVANVIGFQGIFQYSVEDNGSGFGATEVEPIVHSSDPNFRPVDLELGPDGALYFLDWHNPLIGHMQHHLRDPSRDREHGRVYRVTWRDRPLLEPEPIAGRSIPELLELLQSPEDRVRYRVRIELSGRDSQEVVAATRAWAARQQDVHAQLEGLWVQQQHGAVDRPLLEQLLACEEPRARAAATRVTRQMRHQLDDALGLLAGQAVDEHPRVRLEAVVGLSHFPTHLAAEAALRSLEFETDVFLSYALEETLRALEDEWRYALTAAPSDSALRFNAEGVAHLLARVSNVELMEISEAGVPWYEEVLTRPGLEREAYSRAARGLAAEHGSDEATVLLAAIELADEREDGHADHLLMGLFGAVRGIAPRKMADDARRLTVDGRRSSTRRLALAALIDAEQSIDGVWLEAATSLDGLRQLFEAAPYISRERPRNQLFQEALELVGGPPKGLESDGGTSGRYVRVELPGEKRTLTLAEVQVFHRGANLAPAGTATQSSTNWGGVAARALDGNTSGQWGANGQTHTLEDQADPWWELDLGRETEIDRIVLWNRTDAAWGARLDGFVLRVLDADRRVVFQHDGGAAEQRVALEVSDPALRMRRAAVLALASLGVDETKALQTLASLFADPDLRPSVVEAVRSIPPERWPAGLPEFYAEGLTGVFAERIEQGDDRFESETDLELLAFADELIARLESPLRTQLRDVRRRLGPQVIVIRPVRDSLLYDRREFTVVAGRPVELMFDNIDIMPHNLLVTAPGSLAKVGMAGEAMARDPNAWDKGFVPDLAEVMYSTGLLQPGQSRTLSFDAPETPDDYPYVCTFPGHWVRMNGVMHVVADWDEVTDEPVATEASSATGPARPFVRNWSFDDLKPHLSKVAGASPERGREVLETATCLSCHAVDGDGGVTGPDLREAVAQHAELEVLLTHLLDPSLEIREGYQAEIFLTTDGGVVSGRIIEEEPGLLLVQDDPYRDDLLELPLDEIEERTPSDVSLMPAGLFSTLKREEILDLLAYLESLRPDE